jgi:hypothetical protein
MIPFPRVIWLHRSQVYHHARLTEGDRGLTVPCGVVVACERFRGMEGTSRTATQLGLRPCARCFPQPPQRV